MKKIITKIIKCKYGLCLAIFIVFLFVLILKSEQALAADNIVASAGYAAMGAVGGALALLLGMISYIITAVTGLMTTVFVNLLVNVAQYSNIINVPTVINGWVIVRDICNMFFILFLLIIAFATILRVESYNAKKLLPKLLIMAVLINFSRTIFGLLIDFSQVMMLTFVSSFKDGGGWFISMFHVDNWYKLKIGMATSNNIETAAFSQWGTTMAVIASIFAAILTLIVVIVLLGVLIMRIILLWIYTILSPVIFLGFGFPPLQQYTSKIWQDFVKQLMVGPLLAFFLWLALTTAQSSGDTLRSNQTLTANSSSCDITVGASAFFCEQNFQQFIIVIGLLIGGLMVTQQIGGAAGSMAGKGMNWAKKSGSLGLAGAGFGLGVLNDRYLQRKGRMDLNLPRVWKGIKQARDEELSKKYQGGQTEANKVMEKTGRLRNLLALTAMPGYAYKKVMDEGGRRDLYKGGLNMAKAREEAEMPLQLVKFKSKFANENKEQRERTKKETNENVDRIKSALAIEQQRRNTKAVEKLTRELDDADEKAKFVENTDRLFTPEEKTAYSNETKQHQKKLDENIPMYNFEARAAEEKLVDAEMSKIGGIGDAQELVRMLKQSIQQRDRTRVKAIMKKLTKDANDNEAIETLVGDSSYEGVQKLMDGLAGQGEFAHLDAGFDEQEAYALGAQVCEMNKKTNHWEATAGYIMQGNGQWRKANRKEHAKIASTESGKRGARPSIRDDNRLGYIKHITNLDTGEKTDVMTDLGLIKIQGMNNETLIAKLNEDMNESAAKYLLPFIEKLEAEGLLNDPKTNKPVGFDKQKTLLSEIRKRAGKAADFDKQYEDVSDTLDEYFEKIS
jgi:hypothetical protein